MEAGDGSFSLFSAKSRATKRTKIEAPEPAPAPAAKTPVPVTSYKKQPATAPVSDSGDDADAPAAAQPPAGALPAPEAAQACSFKELGLSDWLCSVCDSLGMSRPTQVQQGCIPAILQGRDVIGTAHTGSGKTAAFALPILQKLAKDPYGTYALVLTPTRELAFQIQDQFRALGAGMSLRQAVVIGGMDMQQQARELIKRPHVVVATPGRLADLIKNNAPIAAAFARAAFLVLDEADRLLDPTFENELKVILAALPEAKQTLLFTATMTKSLVRLQQAALKDAFTFQAYEGLHTAARLKEQYVFIPAKVKEVYLGHLLAGLAEHKVRSAIIFCGTCRGCAALALLLEELGLPAAALHSHKSQKARLAALDAFKSEKVPLLLATDVASRGLDIPTVDLVVNYDLPVAARDYVHRVGRTARAGRSGWSLSFVTQYDVDLVHAIEELIGHQIAAFEMPEEEVLKGITKVFAAKRAAALRLAELDSRDSTAAGQRAKKRRRAAEGGRQPAGAEAS